MDKQISCHRIITRDRKQAYWVERPDRTRQGVYYYRHHDGTLFQGVPPLSELRDRATYTSTKFLPSAPLKVYFDFTNRCNLSCRHCITSSSPAVDTSDELSPSRITELITEIADLGTLELATGGGEPFFHPEWERLFRAVTEVGLNLIITTNGLRLTSAVVRVLKQVEPLEVRVSFDGGPKLHEHVRGKNTYRRALRGLKLLVASDIYASARLTLCRGVEDELPVLFDDLVAVGVKQVKIAMVKRAGRAATVEGSHLLSTLHDNKYADILVLLGQRHGLAVQLSADDFPLSIIDAGDPKLRDAETRNCGAGLDTCYITPRGQILGCVVMPNLGFGQLHTQSFREVWEGRIAAEYRVRAESATTRRLCDSANLLKSGGNAILPTSGKQIPLEAL